MSSDRGRALGAAAAVVVLATSYLSARQRPVPASELSITQWFNAAPDPVATLLWPIMQAGQFFAPAVAGVFVGFYLRRRRFAVTLLISGWSTWLLAKIIKELVERERPAEFIPGVIVREGNGGFGFVSGHSAVAACLAVMLIPLAPRWLQTVLAIVAVGVGIARIVYGVHLPADVTGGWALGSLAGLLGSRLSTTTRIPE